MLKVTSIRSLVAALALVPVAAIAQAPPDDPFTKAYADNCAACHGANLEGSAQGVPLAGADLRHGDSVDQIAKSIAEGFPQQDRMPAFGATMDEATIRRLAIFVSEKRHELAYTDFKVSALPTIPEGPIKSEKQSSASRRSRRGSIRCRTRWRRCPTAASLSPRRRAAFA